MKLMRFGMTTGSGQPGNPWARTHRISCISLPRATAIGGVVVHRAFPLRGARRAPPVVRIQVYGVAGDSTVTETVTWLSLTAWHPDGGADQADQAGERMRVLVVEDHKRLAEAVAAGHPKRPSAGARR